MKKIEFLDAAEVRAMHLELAAEHGGSPGVRDTAALEAALARPRNLAAYGNPTVGEVAVAYAEGMAERRPFYEGNERVGFVAAQVFLAGN